MCSLYHEYRQMASNIAFCTVVTMKEETDGFNRVQFIDGGHRGASAQNKQTKSKMGSAGRQWAADEGSAQEKRQRRENRNPEIRSRKLEQPSRRSKHRRTDKDKTD
ncbi:hypothetical protein Q8A67_020752 [Cirrhinus molitorella]|uniref:Uncharacterized protein n=1 Tax=Cirrhinus molitorella TaxID=172907 RepID=A0AA88PCF9_9TELE|nr:hypothetical protein Q8A67_020752 [Cirrhinus molitorella]